MASSKEEWLKQAFYDFDTAEAMFEGKRYVHAVFMAHLALEKGLKGCYVSILNSYPPKTHDLIYLIDILDLNPPDDVLNFIMRINKVHTLTRYPGELDPILEKFNEERVQAILDKTRLFLEWIDHQL